MTLFGIALLLSLSALPQASSSTVSDSAKCSIEGTVLQAATGEPLKKARVVLQKEDPNAQPIVAITGATGQFAFKDVDPGRYRFWVERDGFVRMQYGQRNFQRPSSLPLSLAAGQRVRDIVFRMVAGAVISGRIFDDDGEPLAWASVQVLRTVYESQQRFVPVARAITNDLGGYRLWGLSPGRYLLGVTYARGVAFGSTGGAHESQPTRTSATEESFGATYYPTTTDPSRAGVIELHPGEEASRMDITLVHVHTFRIRGRIVNAVTSQSSPYAFVHLQNRGPGGLRLLPPTAGDVKEADGSFEIRGALPGSYTLIAELNEEGQQFTAQQPIEVGNADLEGIQLVITRGMDLPGRVRAEGQSIPLTKLNVLLQPKESPGSEASVREDGSFLLKNVKDDSELNVFHLPEDSYLKSARLGEDDVLEKGLSTSRIARGETLELVISRAGGRADGVVLDKDGQGVGGAAVILIPRSRETFRLYKSTLSDQNGRYTLQGIAPGEYKIFAWEDIEPGAYRDPEFLRRYEDRGESLHVEESGSYIVELKAIPSP